MKGILLNRTPPFTPTNQLFHAETNETSSSLNPWATPKPHFPPPRHSIMGRKPPLNASKQRKKKVSFFIALLAVIMLTAFYL